MDGKSVNVSPEIDVLLFFFFFIGSFNAIIYFSETDITNELKHWKLDGSDDELRFIASFVFSALTLTIGIVSFFIVISGRQHGRVVYDANVVIRRSHAQGLHPVTSGICFSVVPISNPQPRFVNSQLVCLLPVVIFNFVTFISIFVSFVSVACL